MTKDNGDVEGQDGSSQEIAQHQEKPDNQTPTSFILALCLIVAGIWAIVMTSRYNNIKSKSLDSEYQQVKEFDTEESLVIIGGGLAGTYLAWRLASADDSDYAPADIHLYERTDRIGGRLISPAIGTDLCDASETAPDSSYLPRTELGGMRIRTTDKILLGVVDQLEIKTGPFYMNADDETSAEPMTNPMFARNVLGTRLDWVMGNQIPFTSGPQFFGLDAANTTLHTPTFDALSGPKINPDGFDPCNGEANKEVFEKPHGPTGDPFYSYSFQENARIHSGETSDDNQFFEAISGYAFEGYELGAASPDIAGVLPPKDYQYIRPLDGSQSIPISLDNAAMDLGVSSNLNHEVTRVEELEDGHWLVTIRETETSPCTGITQAKYDDNHVKVIRANRIILALPPSGLSRIDFFQQSDKTDGLEDMIRSLSRKVQGLPLMKLFAAWPTRWWNKVNHLDTFSETDMPKLVEPGARSTDFTCGRFTNDLNSHIYSWYPGTQLRPETVKEHAAACEDMGVIQMYAMTDRIPNYESASQPEKLLSCSANDDDCEACNLGGDDWIKPSISSRLQNLVSLDLSTMFRYEVPDASDIMYRIWKADDPVTMTDAIHFWRAGVKWWEDYNDALQPLGDASTIHIIGEAFSHNQGWMEGATETAEHLVQEVLGIAKPNWLKKEYYCASMPFFVR